MTTACRTNRSALADVFYRLFAPGGPLARFEPHTLEAELAVIYAVDPDGRFLYCNPAWDRFATTNGGRHLDRFAMPGRNLFDSIPFVLRDFYRHHHQEVIRTSKPWEFDFECSSPDQCRILHMRVVPLDDSRGVLIANTQVAELPHGIIDEVTPDFICATPNSPITMCAGCRRIRVLRGGRESWIWNREALIQRLAAVSHGLCTFCCEHYYGRDAVNASRSF